MPDRTDIQAAAMRLSPYLRRTPTLGVPGGEFGRGGDVSLKLEFLQHSGSFKARGAFNRLLTAPAEAARAGVVAASGGNHGAAVAYAARQLGLQATIFVPGPTPATKLARIASYGAELVQGGANYAEAHAASRTYAAVRGALEVHAYDDAAVLAGQGTIGQELEQDAPGLTHLLIAVGGGGLVGGVASWFQGTSTRIIAVEPHGCPTLNAALSAGQPVAVEVGGIAADSLGARQAGQLGFDAVCQAGAESLLVTDEAIAEAQSVLWDRFRIIAEPGGAAAFAPLLDGGWMPPEGSRIGVVLCGANTNPASILPP